MPYRLFLVLSLLFAAVCPAAESWVYDTLKIADFHRQGIDGRGVKIGVFEDGCAVKEGELTLMDGQKFPGGDKHGTGVANVIGNRHFGIAPGARLKIYPGGGRGGDGFAEAIRKAVDEGMDILNFSCGYYTDCPPDMFNHITPENHRRVQEALDYAHQKGVVLIAGGGNLPCNEAPSVPCDNLHVINVGGAQPDGTPAFDLSDNWRHDLIAYAKKVPTMSPSYQPVQMDGTSFACPIVTGLAALILQQKKLTPDEVAWALMDNAKPLGKKGERERHSGYGLAQPVKLGKYRTQAEIDAARAKFIPITKVELLNKDAVYNREKDWYELHVKAGGKIELQTRVTPENATDFVQWYVGNTWNVKAIDRDNLAEGVKKGMFSLIYARDSRLNKFFTVKLSVD